jgi:hypothetical protein
MVDTQVAKDLFGSPVRLRLLLWARKRNKEFFQSEPPREVGVLNQVRIELDRLVGLGMLTLTVREGDRRTYYDLTDSPLWGIVDAAIHVFGSDLP